MNALSAFIVGFPAPVQLSTTNADSAFVVATKDSSRILRITQTNTRSSNRRPVMVVARQPNPSERSD